MKTVGVSVENDAKVGCNPPSKSTSWLEVRVLHGVRNHWVTMGGTWRRHEPVLTHQNIRGVTEGMIPSVDAFDKELCDKRKDFKQFLVLEK